VKSREKFCVLGATIACAGLALAGMLIGPPQGRADDQGNASDLRIERGFEIAPVPLNLEGKNRDLVGLGSYIVNTEGCNDCHDAGPPTEYVVPGGNPYFGKPKQVNTKYYLGGGRDFLALVPGSAHIISRNLTPAPNNKTGLPGGDITLEKFFEIFRHGTDFDNLHPNCPLGAAPNTTCIPAPFDGNLLQVMPWPNLKDLTDHETRAIYEYLRAVPCIQGNYPGPGGVDANIPPEPADRCSE